MVNRITFNFSKTERQSSINTVNCIRKSFCDVNASCRVYSKERELSLVFVIMASIICLDQIDKITSHNVLCKMGWIMMQTYQF